MFNIERQKAWILLATITLTVPHLHAAEILEADPGLSTQFMGKRKTEEHFGSENFIRPQSYNHLLGSIYDEGSRETVLVFGFRLTESFIREWEKQGTAQLIFRVIEFHEGDPCKICPIHIEQLATEKSSTKPQPHHRARRSEALRPISSRKTGYTASNSISSSSLHPRKLSGSALMPPIRSTQKTTTSSLPATSMHIQEEARQCLLPGVGSQAQTVHGMSLLHSLNRRFYAPKDKSELISPKKQNNTDGPIRSEPPTN